MRELRPDIELDMNVLPSSEAKKLATYGFYAPLTNASEGARRKGYATCNSLHDYFLRLCREREYYKRQKIDPQFEFTELPLNESDTKHQKRFRQALVKVFNVPAHQLRMVERRAMNLKPGKPMQFFRTICGLPQDNKQKAKDSACERVLIQELGLVMPYEDDSMKRAAAVLSPPYALHQLMVKQNRKKLPDIVYDEPEDISEAPNKPPMFKCTLTVNGTERFEGTGQSKKAAKSAAAEQALTKLFKFDLSSEHALEMLSIKKSKREEEMALCAEICSIVLIAPDGEKKMVALGAGRHAVIDGQILSNAHGNVLVHMQGNKFERPW
ncbi:unnamed protein product [Gongylonema pulchrum]|uniref:DRBM domain-containing protein n=1 Tax=Gongylonema pulchrum TaxID=637853 RepID=A0A3P7MZD2_9BILA|nr:unnamed protein product [Gongylonema pulchrum]